MTVTSLVSNSRPLPPACCHCHLPAIRHVHARVAAVDEARRQLANRRRQPQRQAETSRLASTVENEFHVDVRQSDQATVLTVSGELDLASSASLEEALGEAGTSKPELVVLDLRGVEFMDSSGLAVIVKAHQRAQNAGRRLGVINGSPQVQRLLSLTGMDERMTVVETAEELLGGG
jgi:anti-anti-sigma factor